jgi:hypothetical protein
MSDVCPHCGAPFVKRTKGSNAVFDWIAEDYACFSWRHLYARSKELITFYRSPACKEATGTVDPPPTRRPSRFFGRRVKAKKRWAGLSVSEIDLNLFR